MPWIKLGVALTDDQVLRLEELAERLGVTRNAVIRFAVDYFLRQIDKGKLDPRKFIETRRRFKPPE